MDPAGDRDSSDSSLTMEEEGLLLEELSLFNICLGKQEVALGREAPLRFELGGNVACSRSYSSV